VADHSPDKGHVIKRNNNNLYKLAKDNPPIRGVHALGSKRIHMLNSEFSATLAEYSKMGIGDNVAWQACLDQLDSIVLHHCGQHHLCRNERWCSYKKIEREHPDWDLSAIAVAAAQLSNCPLEKPMSLSVNGMSAIVTEIKKRFNKKSINKAALAGCSNLAENLGV
jgi:hypothetical protein